MEQAIADLEGIRRAVGVDRWMVLGHSWGCDLAVRYGTEHADAVSAVIGVADRGFQRDVVWSEEYEAGQASEPTVEIDWNADVHAALSASFTEWIHQPDLWRRVADCPVPMHLIAAGDDIRPSWPLQQLASLAPRGTFSVVPGVPHDFWALQPDKWVSTVSDALADV